MAACFAPDRAARFARRPPRGYTSRMLTDVLPRALNWVAQNPITLLTAILVVVTYVYTREMTRSVRILSDQFAAQIRPEVTVSLVDQQWSANCLKASLVITATRETAVLRGGEFTVYCEHDAAGGVVELGIFGGHALPSGGSLRLTVSGKFDCATPHVHGASIAGSIAFSDYKGCADYRCDIRGDWRFVSTETPRTLGVSAILRPLVKLFAWTRIKRRVHRIMEGRR